MSKVPPFPSLVALSMALAYIFIWEMKVYQEVPIGLWNVQLGQDRISLTLAPALPLLPHPPLQNSRCRSRLILPGPKSVLRTCHGHQSLLPSRCLFKKKYILIQPDHCCIVHYMLFKVLDSRGQHSKRASKWIYRKMGLYDDPGWLLQVCVPSPYGEGTHT